MTVVSYRVSPAITNDELNVLFGASWPRHASSDFQPIVRRSLLYVCAYSRDRLVGFVNVAWDGGIHGFILDTTVHPDVRRQGIGSALVRRAAEAARERGIGWLHVDFEPQLRDFYRRCGFSSTEAGLIEPGGGRL